ncbi:MAG: zf-HC2 domain-containing protein [Verrucomicrobiota bacterium]
MKFLAKILAELSPNCREATRLQSLGLDRSLTFRERFGLRIHLLLCRWCRRYGKQIRFLRDAAHTHPDELVEPSPHRLSEEARDRIKNTLKTGGN